MKNITLKIDDDTYRRARVRAAEKGTSISAMVREFLQRENDEETLRETRRIEALEALYTIANERTKETSTSVQPLKRDEIYDTRIH